MDVVEIQEKNRAESEIAISIKNGADARLELPGLEGPTLRITAHTEKADGPQFAAVRFAYGVPTIEPDDDWPQKLILFEVVSGGPRKGEATLFPTNRDPEDTLIRLQRVNGKLEPLIIAEGDQSASNKLDGVPTRLPSPVELRKAADILRNRQDTVNRAVTVATAPRGKDMEAAGMVGKIAAGLERHGVPGYGSGVVQPQFMAPSANEIANFIDQWADKIENQTQI